jgi:hypothetical protein
MKRLITLGLTVVVMGGCSVFNPSSVPVIEDKVGNGNIGGKDRRVGTLATVAQRRLALIRFEDGKFCAEPPPDAVDNISQTLSTALSGSSGPTTVGAQVAASIATVAKQLFYRSQGLQLYRDGMFSLCNAYLNGAVDEPTYLKQQDKLLDVVKMLINTEIPHLAVIKADTTGAPTPTTPTPLP